MNKILEELINTDKPVSMKDIIKIVLDQYEKILDQIQIVTNKTNKVFNEKDTNINFFSKLKNHVDESNINIIIEIDTNLKNIYSIQNKLKKLNVENLNCNISKEILKDNINIFIETIKTAHTFLKKLLKSMLIFGEIQKISGKIGSEKEIEKHKNAIKKLIKQKDLLYKEFCLFRELYNNYQISTKLNNELESGFFGFWVRRYRVSIIALIIVIIYGITSYMILPKESFPDVELGMIGINTIYQGVNPNDIDNLITEKFEQEIQDIEGIDKIESTSKLGISSIIITIEDGVKLNDTLIDIKDKLDNIDIPDEAENPLVYEITRGGDTMFTLVLYGDSKIFSKEILKEKARKLKSLLEGKGSISKISYNQSNDYEIWVELNKSEIETIGLSINDIASIIKDYNKNQPIGNFTIGEKNYDFRFDGEFTNISDLGEIPIKNKGSTILLNDISNIIKYYKDETINNIGFSEKSGYNSVSMTFEKQNKANIFDSSDKAKELINKTLSQNTEFEGINAEYSNDMADRVREDYNTVYYSGTQTLIYIFLIILIFVGLKEAAIGTLAVPLAFLITFAILRHLGLSMNFLTNFSLILSFGIAIDTTIVIIEGAHDFLKQGYNPKNAVLLAVRNYAAPLIAGTMTTLAAFIPLFTLPGMMGKFLSFIPITVFCTLLSALIISLTINSMLFYRLNKPLKKYYVSNENDNNLKKEEKILLDYERRGKSPVQSDKKGLRDKVFSSINKLYINFLKQNIKTRPRRLLLIFLPIIALIATFIFLSPKIGFQLMPDDDSNEMIITLVGPVGTNEDYMEQYKTQIENELIKIPDGEMIYYTINISNNKLNIGILLYEPKERKSKGLRTANEIEKGLDNLLNNLKSQGLKIETETKQMGPPTGKPIGVKLIADSNKKLKQTIEIAEIFEDFLRSIPSTKNVGNSSEETPGQYIFKLDKKKLNKLNLSPGQVLSQIYFITNGVKAGSFNGDLDDYDIKIKFKEYNKNISASDIEKININTASGKIKVSNLLEQNENGQNADFSSSIASIKREDTKILIRVEADLEQGITQDKINPRVQEFAENYKYPEGISYEMGGENQENQELIMSVLTSFTVAVFLIFLILVLQFGSYSQPIIILYSIVLALLGVNIGLFLTNNPYSMPFAIGFISLTGVVVNDAIIMIDRFNKNMKKGIKKMQAILEAASARLNPIMITTITTLLGIMPIAMQDKFWEGLGLTIIFGLFTGSLMTLNVIPALIIEGRFVLKIIFFPIYLPYRIIKILIIKIKTTKIQ